MWIFCKPQLIPESIWKMRLFIWSLTECYQEPGQPSWKQDKDTGWATKELGFNYQHGNRFSFSPSCPDRLWDWSTLLANGYQGIFRHICVSNVWSLPFTSISSQGTVRMELNLHSPIHLHSILNYAHGQLYIFTWIPSSLIFSKSKIFIWLLEVKLNLLCIQDLQQNWSHTEGLASLKTRKNFSTNHHFLEYQQYSGNSSAKLSIFLL
jgi:hypothetical protein